MDSTAQDPNLIQPSAPAQPADHSQQAPVAPVVAPAVPVSVPVGGKEHASMPMAEAQPSQPEVIVPEVVKAAGVESHPNPEVIQLTPEQKQTGMEAAKEATPLPQMPTLHLPIPEEKVVTILKMPNPKNSVTWLALLIKKILDKQRRKK